MRLSSADVVATTSSSGAFFLSSCYLRYDSGKRTSNAAAALASLKSLLEGSPSIRLVRRGGKIEAICAETIEGVSTGGSSAVGASSLDTVNGLVDALVWFEVQVNGALIEDAMVCASRGENEVLMFYDPKGGVFGERPSDGILKAWELKLGLNEVNISKLRDARNKHSGGTVTTASAEKSDEKAGGSTVHGAETTFGLFLYPLYTKFAVVDIDGTITISDVRGYVESVFLGMYTHVHEGVVRFLKVLEENFGYSLIFLTSRPLAHQEETRLLLANARDFDLDVNGKKCIDHTLQISRSPLFVNLKSVTKAVYGEVIAKSSGDFKAGVLKAVTNVFAAAGRFGAYEGSGHGGSSGVGVTKTKAQKGDSVFHLGVGNKDTDMIAYYSAGVPDGRLLFVDSSSSIRLWHPSAELVGSLREGGNASNKRESARDGKERATDSLPSAKPHKADVFTSYMDQNLLYYLDEIGSRTTAIAPRAGLSSSKKPSYSSGKREHSGVPRHATGESVPRDLGVGAREGRSGTLTGPQANVMRDDER
jgi:hypothetical protein